MYTPPEQLGGTILDKIITFNEDLVSSKYFINFTSTKWCFYKSAFVSLRLNLGHFLVRASLGINRMSLLEAKWSSLCPSGCDSLRECVLLRTLCRALCSLSRLSTTWQVSCCCNNRLCLIEQAYWIFLRSEVSGVLNWMQFIVFGRRVARYYIRWERIT